MTKTMYDAAYPPTPPNVDVVAGYIGGNTPHIWTDTEWAASGKRWRLPIFTRSHDGDPKADAAFCVAWLRDHKVPKGVTLALDFETRVDGTYLNTFDAGVVGAGWKVMVYGSLTYVIKNPEPSSGYWAAHWTNVPHICGAAGVVATQWGGDVILNKPYDLNLVSDSVPLWDTQGVDMPILDSTDIASIVNAVHVDVAKMLSDSTHSYLPPIHNKLAKLQESVDAIAAGDPTVIAQTVVDAVGPELASVVAGELLKLTLKAAPAEEPA